MVVLNACEKFPTSRVAFATFDVIALALTLRDTTGRAEGRIVLYFNMNPISLRGWTVIDAQGKQTQIRVLDLQTAELDPGLFVLPDPRPARPGR